MTSLESQREEVDGVVSVVTLIACTPGQQQRNVNLHNGRSDDGVLAASPMIKLAKKGEEEAMSLHS